MMSRQRWRNEDNDEDDEDEGRDEAGDETGKVEWAEAVEISTDDE